MKPELCSLCGKNAKAHGFQVVPHGYRLQKKLQDAKTILLHGVQTWPNT